ncbi:cysteine hydrolase family protein [Streptomyces agglomeratus]|uniref:cysteine hydrolase family protein n=1 Tax=Streptomyces agglomeratus TaxID=285458 RepID=UPI0034E43ED1
MVQSTENVAGPDIGFGHARRSRRTGAFRHGASRAPVHRAYDPVRDHCIDPDRRDAAHRRPAARSPLRRGGTGTLPPARRGVQGQWSPGGAGPGGTAGCPEQPPGSGFGDGLVRPGDIVVVKRTVGAFHDTGLDDQLRRRGVASVVLAGLVTTMGVESTARAASDHGYEVEFVADAMSGFTADEHDFTVERIFPRFGEVRNAADYE